MLVIILLITLSWRHLVGSPTSEMESSFLCRWAEAKKVIHHTCRYWKPTSVTFSLNGYAFAAYAVWNNLYFKRCGYYVADNYIPVLSSWWCAVTPAICACNLAAVVPTLWMWWGGDSKCCSRMSGETDPYWPFKFTAKVTRITSVWFSSHENNSSHSSQIHHFWSGTTLCDLLQSEYKWRIENTVFTWVQGNLESVFSFLYFSCSSFWGFHGSKNFDCDVIMLCNVVGVHGYIAL